MTLGDIIKEYRSKHKMSMDKFSDLSGISKAYISLLEKNKHPKTGKTITPSIQCIKQAADAMNIDFNVLFSELDCLVSLETTKNNNCRTSNRMSTYNESFKENVEKNSFSKKEVRIIEMYRKLDERGKETIDFMLEKEFERQKEATLSDEQQELVKLGKQHKDNKSRNITEFRPKSSE